MFTSSLTSDLLKGLAFLHNSDVRCHGNLRSSNCVVDSRWTLKLTDFGVDELKHGENEDPMDERTYFYRLFWTAPELLRFKVFRRPIHQLNRHLQALRQCLDVPKEQQQPITPDWNPRGDIYALGIVLFELYGRQRPYFPLTNTPRESVRRVIVLNDEFHVPFRPKLSQLSKVDKVITECIAACWNEQPLLRPNIKQVRFRLKDHLLSKNRNIFDNMMTLMEAYAKNLERLVNERTGQLIEEKKRTEELLYQMLPIPVAEQLKRNKKVEAEAFDAVTIFFSDIVGFTELSANSTPFEVVQLLNDLYTTCDKIIANYQVFKVETIGDAYMVVCGVPRRNGKHAGEIADMSIHLLQEITSSFVIRHRPGERLKLRVGINSGACCAGVVGTKMPRFCLFGDTVNMASRMEINGEPCRIHISESCKLELDRLGGYIVSERGEIDIKGRGQTRTFWLCGRYLSNGETYTIDSCDQKHPLQQPVATSVPLEAVGTVALQQKSARNAKGPNFLARNFLNSVKPRSKAKKQQDPEMVIRSKAGGQLNDVFLIDGPSS